MLGYYAAPPELHGVEIHSVRLYRDGPTIELIVEMPRFPDTVSKRWPVGANTAHATLRFFDLRDVSISSFGRSNIGDLHIDRTEDDLIQFRFECSGAALSGTASFFDVIDVVAYLKDSA
jgi:hypothetical protein